MHTLAYLFAKLCQMYMINPCLFAIAWANLMCEAGFMARGEVANTRSLLLPCFDVKSSCCTSRVIFAIATPYYLVRC